MKNYLITGATGWLGKNFLKKLISNQQTSEVRILSSTSEFDKLEENIKSNIILFEGDIRNKETLFPFFKNTEEAVLIHLAGCIHPKIFSKDFDEINFIGTKNVIDISLVSRVSKAIVISSNSPMGCNPTKEHLFTEESPYLPYMGYGKSKYKMENYLRAISIKNTAPITIIRAPWFYGPYQPPRQKQFFEMIRKGKVPIVGSGENKRSMVFVENLCDGINLVVESKKANNQIFWIADRLPYSMNEIIDTVEDILEKDFGVICARKRVKLPNIVSDIAQVVDWSIQKMGLYNQKFHVLSEMNKNISCSIEKANRILGYNPRVSLREGMRKSLAEFYK